MRQAPCTSASVCGGLFLLISLLYIRFILRVGPLGPFDAVIEPPEPPLCLLTGGPALVVALPLLEQTAAAASAALAERLEQWHEFVMGERAVSSGVEWWPRARRDLWWS